ncbi:hypothetical protein DFQ26_007645, partial [Actinomortierella ambigua]
SRFPKMTHRMTLLAIAAIATTTFMSTFAHAFNVKITDQAGASHTFEITPKECKKFDGVIEAVASKTDAGECYLYESGDCKSKSENDHLRFDSGGVEGQQVFKALSVRCEEMSMDQSLKA